MNTVFVVMLKDKIMTATTCVDKALSIWNTIPNSELTIHDHGEHVGTVQSTK